MPKIKTQHKGLMLHFAAFVLAVFGLAIINSGSAFAAASLTTGVFTDDATDIRWEWELYQDSTNEEEPQKLTIKFYDKPANLTTVTVPSLSTVISKVPSANSTLNTYYLSNGSPTAQDEAYPDLTRREATADTTKLDMTNTSKIQILGVRPIINPEVETELIFGQNMVIGDGDTGKVIRTTFCGTMYYSSWGDNYYCNDTYSEDLLIPNELSMTPEELSSYTPTFTDVNCYDYNGVTKLTYDSSRRYCSHVTLVDAKIGVFANYKLKLTNFIGSNFNYVGWNAFMDTKINGKTVTISGDGFKGSNIFMNSDVENVTIETENIGAGIFKNCQHLKTITFADSVTKITDDAFAGTNLTSFDFSTTPIKTIGPRAFDGAKLTSIKLDGVNRIEYMAFANNDIKELYLPKSINYLQSYLFKGNKHMKKLTIAYDTLTSGTTLPMFVVLDNEYGSGAPSKETPSHTIEEINIIAPYASDETVSDTHVTYNQYKWNFNAYTQRYMPECPNQMGVKRSGCNGNSAAYNDYGETQYGPYVYNYYDMSSGRENYSGSGSDFEDKYAHVDTYKNVLAPIYFHYMPGIRKITLSEGYEFIGAMAFYNYKGTGLGSGMTLFEGKGVEQTGYQLNLPNSLRGVGNGAFFGMFQDSIDFTIPRNIEFIGINAFMDTFFYDGDVDFPNLVALGDHAFEKTRVRNIHLYDKIQYMGMEVFADCLFLNDITFDFDVFDPNLHIAWAQPHRGGNAWYDSQFHFTQHFGPRYPYGFSNQDIAKYGIRVENDTYRWNGWPLKFGTITFTEKNVSQLPNGYNNCYYGRYIDDSGKPESAWHIDDVPAGTKGCPDGSYGTGIYNTFFGHVNADKIDISKTAWKVLSPRMFVQTSIDEVVLPENLEVIPGDSFSDAIIKKELVLPDTIKVIGDAAFNYGQIYNKTVWNPETSTYDKDWDWINSHTIKITKLPASLEYVGNDAFWGDTRLTADLNSPNLWFVGWKAFWGTKLRDVYLPPSIKSLHSAAFSNISTLRNITIDFDLGALPPNYNYDDLSKMPQSIKDFAGGNLYQMIHMSCSAHGMATNSYAVTTFYSIFNQEIGYDVESTVNGRTVIVSYGQKTSNNHFGKLTFTENAKTAPYMTGPGYFGGLEFDEVDLGASGWKTITGNVPWGFEGAKIGKLTLPAGLETVTMGAFQNAEIKEAFALPDSLKTVGQFAFQEAKVNITNLLPDSVEVIDTSAFYGTDAGDNVTIPGSVTRIGWSPFNAGPTDVHYDTITIEPDITASNSQGQLVHQIFWGNDVDKMVVKSSKLTGYDMPDYTENSNGTKTYYEEFWHMPFDEVEITNLPTITYAAFNGCSNLKKVDMGKDANLRTIRDRAFENAENLDTILFAPSIKDETVAVGSKAFRNTGFKTVGQAGADFNLRAAHFDANTEVFSDMKKLEKVDVPETYSNGTIPAYTFYNDPKLEEASVAYKVKFIDNAAFANDNGLKRIFIWGDTVVNDENLAGYTAPSTPGMGYVSDDEPKENVGPTIPEDTDIYAYSSWSAEPYAGSTARENFEGDFYALDEVLYLTTNKTHVKVNDEETDFDKTGMIVYGLRRDGVVLESKHWAEYDGTAYTRNDKDLSFSKMTTAVMENPEFATVWDTPVPVNELSLANENFANIDFELVDDEDGVAGIKRVNIIYTDAYTGGEPDTDVLPITDGDPTVPVPVTLDNIIKAIAMFGVVAVAGTGALIASRKMFRRR